MHIALMANINGNFPAFAAALSKIEELKEEGYRIEKFYILGNVVGIFPYAREIFDALDDLVKKNDVRVIRGRYDQIIAEAESKRDIDTIGEPEYVKRALKHAWESLDHDGREFIRGLPIYLVDKIGGNEIFGVYGSPLDPIGGEVLPEQPQSYYEALMRPMRRYELLLIGSSKLPLEAFTRYGKVISPGSLGLVPSKGQNSTFAILNTEKLDAKFIEVGYERKIIEEKIKREGLPGELVKLLYHGRL